jgi:hypothetical protein
MVIKTEAPVIEKAKNIIERVTTSPPSFGAPEKETPNKTFEELLALNLGG